MTIELPNIRKLFIPDEGYMIFDADLAGADAQVVAAEAGDHDLLTAFKGGIDIHAKNATDLWKEAFTSLKGAAWEKKRKEVKQGVHATNYGVGAKTLSTILGWSITEVEKFQRNWFQLHPGIRDWHRRVEADLRSSRIAANKFGYRIIYFDRVEALLPQALAWIPQSTVALVAFYGALQLEKAFPWVEILLQVHDSVVFQVPFKHADRIDDFRKNLSTPIPYDDPLTIAWSLSRSDKSWGDCTPV